MASISYSTLRGSLQTVSEGASHTDTLHQHHFILTSSYFTAVLLSHRCETMISPVKITLCLFNTITAISISGFVVGPLQAQTKCPIMTQENKHKWSQHARWSGFRIRAGGTFPASTSTLKRHDPWVHLPHSQCWGHFGKKGHSRRTLSLNYLY